MTPLKKRLIRQIATTGPITLADYMAACLLDPRHGYYSTAPVFGADGDFITAPDISQMFGEMIGLWCTDRWRAMGSPDTLRMIELGPGRGTLMADMLRTARRIAGFHDAITVHFIERGAARRNEQSTAVPSATWHDSLDGVPDGPCLIVANEFFDALPIHQFEKQGDIWQERRVAADEDRLGWTLTAPGPQLALLAPGLDDAPAGSIAEVCPAGLSIVGQIADRLKRYPGCALIIDYGHSVSATGDTFQAVSGHAYADPFDAPGQADLTAHVDFAALRRAALQRGIEAPPPTEQGTFLMTLGIGERAVRLSEGQDTERQARLLADLKRLTAPDQMGTLFKVLALATDGLAPPPGFGPS